MTKTIITNRTAAYNGALVAVAGVFVYSFIVMFYTIIRSSASIYNIMSSSELNTILWANGFSIAYSVAVFSLLMAVVSSIAGAVGGIILRKVLLLFNPQRHLKKAIVISSITAIVLLAILYFLLYMLLKERITFQYVETFLFWYVFPTGIFFIAVVIGGAKLNNYSTKMGND